MRFALIPAGDEDTASSRIRIYTLSKALRDLGHEAMLGHSSDSDILFIQKRVTSHILEVAKQAKSKGTAVLYDVDDVGEALWSILPQQYFYEMLRVANVVTTDTPGHKQLLRKYGAKEIEIIPDAIDYYPTGPVRGPKLPDEPLRILLFGNWQNIVVFEKYASLLKSIPSLDVVITSSPNGMPEWVLAHDRFTFVPWSRNSFIRTLQSCHLSCLVHDVSPHASAKSNNRMITSIAWGVPALASRTPEYECTARDAGIEFALFSDELELASSIERLRSRAERAAYLDSAQPGVWHHYAPAAVARKFVETATKCHAKNSTLSLPVRQWVSGKRSEGQAKRLKSRVGFEFWRFRLSEDRRKFVGTLIKKTIKRTYNHVMPQNSIVKSENVNSSELQKRNYLRDWVNPEGAAYRMQTYDRQRNGGHQPLTENPSASEVCDALRIHHPQSVLEVGCGWGRLLEKISEEFSVEGCDVSLDMLKLCSPKLRVFQLDIAVDNYTFLKENAGRWDVIMTRGVMLYFMDLPAHMAYAMNNMLMLAAKKILIWEWPEVCDRMREFSKSAKFEYHPIEHRSE